MMERVKARVWAKTMLGVRRGTHEGEETGLAMLPEASQIPLGFLQD